MEIKLIEIKNQEIYLEQFIQNKFLTLTGDIINQQMAKIFKGFLTNSYKDLLFLDKQTNDPNLVVRLDDEYICICKVIIKEVEGQEEDDIYLKVGDKEILYSSEFFRLSNYEMRMTLKGAIADYMFPKGINFYTILSKEMVESNFSEFDVIKETDKFRIWDLDGTMTLEIYRDPGNALIVLVPDQEDESKYSAVIARNGDRFINVSLGTDLDWNFDENKIDEILNFVELLEAQNVESFAESQLQDSGILLDLSGEFETVSEDNHPDGLVDESSDIKPDGLVDEPKQNLIKPSLFTKL